MVDVSLPWRAAEARARLNDEFKGALAWGEVGSPETGWRIEQAAETPIAVMRESALLHNAERMREYCDGAGFLIAPHAKTTMSPELIEFQISTGAWAFAVATAYQARRVMEFGADRVMLAAEVIDRAALVDLMQRHQTGKCRELMFFVDSIESLEAIAAASAVVGGDYRGHVLIELGHLGGRTGVRGVDVAVDLARSAFERTGVHLRGIAGYEGTVPGIRTDEGLQRVDGFLEELKDVALTSREFLGADGLVTVGGSMYLDRVRERLADLPAQGLPVAVRSGCYLTHDHGLYETASHTTPMPSWSPGVEVWARVISHNEPTLAIATAGRRDLSYDQGLPVAVKRITDGRARDLTGVEVFALSDQHAWMRLSDGTELAVGDLVGFGISHPCTTFDSWQVLAVVDDDDVVVGVCSTYF
jgi:D-serine dehydratase